MRRLVNIASSRRLRNAFAAKFALVQVPIQTTPAPTGVALGVKFWSKLGRDVWAERTASGDDELIDEHEEHIFDQIPNSFGTTTHCECAMIAYLHNESINGFKYVGISKLRCGPCDIWIKAFNWSISSNEWYVTKGCHAKWYPGWSAPNPKDVSLLTKVNAKLIESAKLVILSSLVEVARGRSASDSTIATYDSGDWNIGDDISTAPALPDMPSEKDETIRRKRKGKKKGKSWRKTWVCALMKFRGGFPPLLFAFRPHTTTCEV